MRIFITPQYILDQYTIIAQDTIYTSFTCLNFPCAQCPQKNMATCTLRVQHCNIYEACWQWVEVNETLLRIWWHSAQWMLSKTKLRMSVFSYGAKKCYSSFITKLCPLTCQNGFGIYLKAYVHHLPCGRFTTIVLHQISFHEKISKENRELDKN